MFEIAMSAPGKNALGTALMEDLLAKIADAAGRPVLLTGAGDAFSAGLNLKEVAAADRASMERFLKLLVRVVDAFFNYPAPTVALINGHAIAGGCVMALACDYRVVSADPKIRMGINEVALGLRYPPSILELVRRRAPAQHLETLVLGAALHAPEAALRLGLVDEVATDARAAAERALAALSAHPAHAYAVAKKDLRPPFATNAAAEREFLDAGLPVWTSPELKERIAKLLAR
jgi:enoyl-CoA hydratase